MEPDETLAFESTSSAATGIFRWAAGQALAYASTRDPVGPWYEAALPGREAFCMRDVSHQSLGAHLLGLSDHTRNMLHWFARSVTEPRDWCSLWEIDRNGSPPPEDYRNDDEFWFCLPANFDVLDCCLRMHTWTGDRAYLEDPVFLEFYRRTVYEHVERWDLAADRIMRRARLLNSRGEPAGGSRLTRPRGIPGYDEGDHEYTVGFDLVATLHAGYLAYAAIQELRRAEREAVVFRRRAAEIHDLARLAWWDPARRRYYDRTNAAGLPVHADGSSCLAALHWRLPAEPERTRAVVEQLEQSAAGIPPEAVEPLSHCAEILYRHERSAAAFEVLRRLKESPRRAYPEVAFTVVGAVAAGLMGIEADRGAVRTTPRLPDAGGRARLARVPVRANRITVEHEGSDRTTLTNESGPALVWSPVFPGAAVRPPVIVGPGETATARP